MITTVNTNILLLQYPDIDSNYNPYHGDPQNVSLILGNSQVDDSRGILGTCIILSSCGLFLSRQRIPKGSYELPCWVCYALLAVYFEGQGGLVSRLIIPIAYTPYSNPSCLNY